MRDVKMRKERGKAEEQQKGRSRSNTGARRKEKGREIIERKVTLHMIRLTKMITRDFGLHF